jgi:hypothetical protein
MRSLFFRRSYDRERCSLMMRSSLNSVSLSKVKVRRMPSSSRSTSYRLEPSRSFWTMGASRALRQVRDSFSMGSRLRMFSSTRTRQAMS